MGIDGCARGQKGYQPDSTGIRNIESGGNQALLEARHIVATKTPESSLCVLRWGDLLGAAKTSQIGCVWL